MDRAGEWLVRIKHELAFIRGNLLVITISWAIWRPFNYAVHVYDQVYVLALGADTVILGLMAATSSVILGLVRFLGGYVADRHGRKRILVSMTFVYSSALFLYALAPDWRWVFAASIITSICLLYQPALSAILSDSMPPEKRGLGFALSELLPELVGLPAPLLAMYLVGTYGLVTGMRLAYAFMATTGIIAALIRLALEETLPREARAPVALGDFLNDYKRAVRFALRGLRPYLVVLASNSLTVGIFSVIQPFIIYYLGISFDEWGIIYMLGSVASLVVLLPAGILVDKLGRKNSLIVGFSSYLVAVLVLTIAKPLGITVFWPVAGLMILLWSSSYLTHNALSALEADLVPRELRGKLSAFFRLLLSVGRAISSAACGFLYAAINPSASAAFCSLAALASLMAASTALKEPEHRHE